MELSSTSPFFFWGGLSRILFFPKRLNWCLRCLYENTVTDWHPPFQRDAVKIELWSRLAAPSIFHFLCFGMDVSSSSCGNISFSFSNGKILMYFNFFFQNIFVSLFWPAAGLLLGNFWAAAYCVSSCIPYNESSFTPKLCHTKWQWCFWVGIFCGWLWMGLLDCPRTQFINGDAPLYSMIDSANEGLGWGGFSSVAWGKCYMRRGSRRKWGKSCCN